MTRLLTLLIALFLFWLMLSGIFTPFLVTAGAGSAIAVLILARRMETASGSKPPPFRPDWPALFSFWLWLSKEIMVSSWDVTKRILNPKLPISPTLTEFTPSQTTKLGLVTHANSITLTPGTICIEAEPGRFLVHALTREGAESLAGSEMDRRCTRLEAR